MARGHDSNGVMKGKVGKLRILMVCMGNICRSPLAEVIVRAAVAKAGFSDLVEIDSAGTHACHSGEPPDVRARQVAARRGYDLSHRRARRVKADDFARFDCILAMDRANLEALERVCPPVHRRKLKLFAGYAPGSGAEEIPDPYYGGVDGFERVLELCEAASRGLLAVYLHEMAHDGHDPGSCVADRP